MQQKSELPEGWAETPLEQILSSLESGSRPKGGVRGISEGIPSIGGEHLNDNGGFRFDKIKFVAEEFFEKMNQGIIKVNDILIVKDGATTGKVSIVKTDFPYDRAAVNEHVFLCRTYSELSSDYIFYFLFSEIGQKRILNNFRGSAQGGINKSFAPNTMIPLPPLAEQYRIVSAIEALFARLDAANEKLDRVQEILKKFRQSVLAAAREGKLTEDWRKKHLDIETGSSLINKIKKNHELEGKGHGGKAAPPTDGIHKIDLENIPTSWGVTKLKWLCKPGRSITYGILKPGPDQSNGVPYIRVADFPNDSIVLDGIKRTTSEIANNYKRSSLNTGDILLSIRGTVGRVCRVPEELQGANLTQDTARISVHEEIDADFIVLFLRSPSLQKVLEKAIKGVAIRGINIGDVRELQILLPPLLEQQEIVRRVDALFAFANSIKTKVAAAREKIEKLRQSILAKAFSGELVQTEAEIARREGRDYEMAEVLIERIKAEKGNKEKKQ